MAQKRFIAKNGLDNNSLTITNLADPTTATDAVTRQYATNATNLDSGTVPTARLGSGTANATTVLKGNNTWALLTLEDLPDAWAKKACNCATTAALTFNTAQTTIDGVSISATSRVLIKNQATASQNGIYTNVTTTTWTRATDANIANYLAGAVINVDDGTVNGGKLFDTDFKSTDVIDTTALTFYNFLNTSSVTGSDAVVLATNPTITTLKLAAGGTAAGTAPLKIATSSGVVLTTPESGTVEFTGSNFCGTVDTRGVIPSFQQFYLSSAGAVLSGATQNYFGASSAAQLAATSSYDIECFCYFSKATSGSVRWIPTCSTFMALGHSYLEYIPVTGVLSTLITGAMVVGEATGRTLSTLSHAATANLTTSVFHIHKLRIRLITNTAVNFRLNVTISSGSITPQEGSYYTVRKVISSVGTFVV